MSLTFKGRAVLPGTAQGRALVTRNGFNTYASFFTSIHVPTGKAICADSGNPELYGKDLANRIICLPQTAGSTSSGAVWQRLADMGSLPRAMLFSRSIDALAAAGLVVAYMWAPESVITVDRLGDEFLERVTEGDWIRIDPDGCVHVSHQAQT